MTTNKLIMKDENVYMELIDQIKHCSRMYWKSISQQNLLVTTLSQEMVTKIYPYFADPNQLAFGRNNL